jgi:hypothetical protein
MADAGDWKRWPRKLDAHVQWGVRQRQIEQYTRSGKLKIWACPDGTFRLDPDAVRELFGEPGVVQGRDRDLPSSERKRKLAEADEQKDPVVMMFREAVSMMKDMHRESIGLLRVVSDPLKTLLDAYAKTIEAQAERIKSLEVHADEAIVLKSELADAQQEREVSLARHRSSEKRRDETLTLLKEQVPTLVRLYTEGDSLSGWAKRAPRDVVETIIDSGTIAESDADILRRAAGIPPKPAPNPNSNGVSDHGHS